jgi:hypothetical protein
MDCGLEEGAGRVEFVRVVRVPVMPVRERVEGNRDPPSAVDCVRIWPAGLRVDGKRLNPVVVRATGFAIEGAADSEDCESSERLLVERVVLFVPARGRFWERDTDSMPITLMGR